MARSTIVHTSIFSGCVSCRCAACGRECAVVQGFFVVMEVEPGGLYLSGGDGANRGQCHSCPTGVVIPAAYEDFLAAEEECHTLKALTHGSIDLEHLSLVPCDEPQSKYLSFAFTRGEYFGHVSGHA